MKWLILLLSLLLATPANAIIFIGGSGEPPDPPAGCTTQAEDVSFTTTNVYSIFDPTEERGQSWKAGAGADGKKLYSISLRRNSTNYGTPNLSYRIGTTSNLSVTYLVGATCIVPDATGFFECLIPASDRPTLTVGTTYYLIMRTSDYWEINRDTSSGGNGTYADGTAFYDTNRNWIGTTSIADYPFKTKYCVN